MNEATEPVLLALTGQLPFVVIAGSIAALMVSFVTLWLYRRAILKFMSRHVGASASAPVRTTSQGIDRGTGMGELSLSVVDSSAGFHPADSSLFERAQRALHRNVLIYALAGAVWSLILTVAVLWSAGMAFLPVRFLMVFWVYGWPVVLTLFFIATPGRRGVLLLCGGYFAVLAVLSALALWRSTELTPGQIMILWVFTNLPPTLLMYAFLARPIRAVGPLILVLMLTAMTGAVLALATAGSNAWLLRVIAELAFGAGLNASATFVAILISGFVLFAALGWFLLGFIRRGYLNKRLNDQSIMLDAIWLLFAVFASIGLAFEGSLWALSGILAFIAYKVVVIAGFRMAAASTPASTRNTQLLLLRVFSLGKRSEKLFDPVANLWRYIGNVNLIAGPDLATTTVEPHEFLSFISGRISSLFVRGSDDMHGRVSGLDTLADFDGRYRIHDYFCYADTWQLALATLVKRSDAVLMDLRGFSPQNSGCVHELNELVNVVPLQQVVLVIDNTTDFAFLEKTLKQAWRDIGADSPNRVSSAAMVKIFRIPQISGQAITILLQHLADAAHHALKIR